MDYKGNTVAITCIGKFVSADEIQFARDAVGMAHEALVAKRAT